MRSVVLVLAVAMGLLAGPAMAGAGAIVNACIYLPVAPSSALSVNFTPSNIHCMSNVGSSESMSVTTAGVSCTSIGYVEAKSTSSDGDACGTDDSNWLLSYNTTQNGQATPYTGATASTWSHPIFGHNHITLSSQSAGTVVCLTSDLCTSTEEQWDSGTQGPLYIIFQPQVQ